MTGDLATRLLAARADGDHFPDWLNGAVNLGEALDLQLAVLQTELEAGATIGGWKVGLTSEASRRKLGADERPFGFVLAERSFASGSAIPSADITTLSVEAEMCFTVGADIDDHTVGPDRILDHMLEVSAGFELNEARTGSTRPDFHAMVTDCLTNWGIVSGPGIAPPRAATLSTTTITMERNGEPVFSGSPATTSTTTQSRCVDSSSNSTATASTCAPARRSSRARSLDSTQTLAISGRPDSATSATSPSRLSRGSRHDHC